MTELLISLVQEVNRERLLQEKQERRRVHLTRILTPKDMEVLFGTHKELRTQQDLHHIFVNDSLDAQTPDFSSEGESLDNR
jgi:propanediol utilization protein